ncbi:response regulator [Crenalkalicoccus roseus]|uniref:response regulator n=1 Tax=Crenalkalicoccus roseus TaxID=1485588 RepID=UPI001080EA78|nr:response regulator [Crenalkalicoccus roseus]
MSASPPAADAQARMEPCRILHLEDSAIDAELVAEVLAAAGIVAEIERVDTREDLAAALARGGYDVILADHSLPGFDGLEALAMARRAAPRTPFIFVSGALGEEAAVEAMKDGAADYVVKHRLGRLPVAVHRVLAERRAHDERRRAEAALRESETRFHLAANAVGLGSWQIEPASGVLRACAVFRRHTGLAPTSDLRLDDLLGAAHPQDRARLRAALDGGGECEIEFRLAGSGPERWVQMRGRRLGAAGRELAGVSLDVTERRRAEEVLRQDKQALERRVGEALAERKVWADIFETTDAAICALDLEGRFMAINRACAQALERGYGIRPGVGDSLPGMLSLLPQPQRARIEALWRRALSGEEFSVIEPFGPEAPETPRYEFRFSVLRDRDGRRIGALKYGRDVTDRLRQEARLAETEDRLRQAQKMEALGQLAGGVAHDFNNVLQAVLGGARMILRRPTDAEAVVKFATLVVEAAERGASVARRLLAFARRDTLLRAEAVDTAELLLGLREVLAHTLGGTIRVEAEVPPGVPPLQADRGQLEAVLVNLAANARDAMPRGGTLTLTVAAEEIAGAEAGQVPPGLAPGAYLRIMVSDTGEGMAPEVLARAAEPFFTTKPQGKGTGLGLAMAKGFAEQSGGALALESAPGRGTKVSLWLPQATEEVAQAPGLGEAVPAAPATACRILLVDDEPAVRTVLAAALRERGYDVVEAEGGATALDRLDGTAPFDLLVTDLAMPGVDGLSLIREARRRHAGLPVLLLTGYVNDVAALVHGEAAGGGPFALGRKPASPGDIADRVAALLAGRTCPPARAEAAFPAMGASHAPGGRRASAAGDG